MNLDTAVDKDETFMVTLSNPTGEATISSTAGSATGKIKNNDALTRNILDVNDSYSANPVVCNNSDDYTKVNKVNVEGIPDGVNWEYNIGGAWIAGDAATNGTGVITLPDNSKWDGVKHTIKARIKAGQGYNVESTTSDDFTMTLDKVARSPVATGYNSSTKVLTGISEAGAFVFNDQNKNGTWESGEEFATADASGVFNLNLTNSLQDYADNGPDGWDKIQASLSTIDKAGNTIDVANQAHLYYFETLNTYDFFEGSTRDGGLAYRTHNLSNASDMVLTNGLNAGRYNFNDGNDSLYAANSGLATGTKVYMGAGDDYVRLNRGLDGSILDMGEGNDVFVGTSSTYIGYQSSVNMGAGDDTLYMSRTRELTAGNAANSLDGGDGMDQMIFQGSGMSVSLSKTKGFESFDLTGSGNNTLEIENVGQFTDNSGSIVDSAGVTHSSVLLVKGDSGDSIDWFGATSSSGTATYQGVNYDIYTDGAGNQLFVQDNSGITVI